MGSGAVRLLAMACAVLGVCIALSTPADAQRGGGTSNGGNSGGGRSGGGGNSGSGGGGFYDASRLLLQVTPKTIDNLDEDGATKRTKPARKRAAVQSSDDDADDNEPTRNKPKPGRGKPTDLGKKLPKPGGSRVTAIPPLPATPPERILPPPVLANAPLPQRRDLDGTEQSQFRPGEIVVMVRGVAEPDQVAEQLVQGFNVVLQERLALALLGPSRVYRFSIPDNRPVETVAAAMSSAPGVGFAVPNTIYRLQGSAGTPSLDLQYALPKMHVPAAQAMGRGRGMTIAVIDSGVDAKHPSLKNAQLTLFDATKRGIGGPEQHGTAITGIIAASGAMIGIAPEARIIAVRAFASEKLGEPPVTDATTLAIAVDAAFSQGARIFNMSFAGRREPLLIEAIDAAYAQGAVFVAAAGNDGPDAPPAFPAAHDKVIAITATDEADEIYDRANRGRYVLASAPGVNILAPVTGQGFDYLSGTSFAAAHVTGVVALMMERNPLLTAQDVRRALVDSARDLGKAGQDSEFGAGLTDAYGALQIVGGTGPVATAP